MLEKKLCSHPSENELLISLRLILKGELTQSQAIDLIQDVYSDEIGGTGHYRLTPNDKQFYTTDYVHITNRELQNKINNILIDSIFERSVVVNNDKNTVVNLLLITSYYESEQEELESIPVELQGFIDTGRCLAFEQLDANPCDTERVILNSDEVRSEIRTEAKSTEPAEWTTIDIHAIVHRLLNIDLDFEDVELFGGLLAYFNNCQKLDQAI